MNLYRIGFYRNEMPESVLVVLAENEEQAKSFWPVSAERPAVACCYDGAVSTPMVTPGVVLKQGRWDDYSHPGLEFVSESARHTWNLTTGKTRVYFGHQAKQPSHIKLYLVYSDVATEDYVDTGIIVGATTPEAAFAHWDGDKPGIVSVCELPLEAGLVTNIKCEQGQELTWMRQDYLTETTFEYTPRKVTQ